MRIYVVVLQACESGELIGASKSLGGAMRLSEKHDRVSLTWEPPSKYDEKTVVRKGIDRFGDAYVIEEIEVKP
jgi:hypothetical protein